MVIHLEYLNMSFITWTHNLGFNTDFYIELWSSHKCPIRIDQIFMTFNITDNWMTIRTILSYQKNMIWLKWPICSSLDDSWNKLEFELWAIESNLGSKLPHLENQGDLKSEPPAHLIPSHYSSQWMGMKCPLIWT